MHMCLHMHAHIDAHMHYTRRYDKSLQIIVCQNGAAGVNFEHSVIDGHTVLRYM